MDPNSADSDVGVDAHLITRYEVVADPLESDAEYWELSVTVVEVRTGEELAVDRAFAACANVRLVDSILEVRYRCVSARNQDSRHRHSRGRVTI